MFSQILAILLISLRSLWMHRLRSGLTTLGIVFGVSSVIAMLAIGEGASQQAQAQIAHLGSTNIILKTVKPPDQEVADASEQSIQEYGLRYADAERFRETIPNAQAGGRSGPAKTAAGFLPKPPYHRRNSGDRPLVHRAGAHRNITRPFPGTHGYALQPGGVCH
jgi:DNA-binding NarL/FixJ family response regulator